MLEIINNTLFFEFVIKLFIEALLFFNIRTNDTSSMITLPFNMIEFKK